MYMCGTFDLDSRRVGSGRLLPPSPPVLTETLGLGDEGTQGVFLEPVRVLEGEPLPILPLREHKFHHIHFELLHNPLGLEAGPKNRLQLNRSREFWWRGGETRWIVSGHS